MYARFMFSARWFLAIAIVATASRVDAQVIATRQVSTLDVTPTLLSQTDASAGNDPYAPLDFVGAVHYTQLFTPAVDNGSVAFTASAHAGHYDSTRTLRSALFVIDDLVPTLDFGDGTTNTNVKSLGHTTFDATTGVFTNLPGTAAYTFDETPNGFSFDAGNISATFREQFQSGWGILEGAPPTRTSIPLTPHELVFDPNPTLFAGFETDAPERFANGAPGAAVSRDGDRTVYSIGLDETGPGNPVGFRFVLQVHEAGVGTTMLAVSPVLTNAVGFSTRTDGNEQNLPNGVAYEGARYISADAGQFAIATRDDRVYLFDASNNATLLATGSSLDHITLDSGDVVVGRGTGLANSEVRSVSTQLRDDGANFMYPSNGAISRIDNGGFVDLVNTSTFIPGTNQTFHSFGTFSYSDGNMAFLATGSNASDIAGLFVLYHGVVHEIALYDELFDSRTVAEIDLHREGLDGDTLAFIVTFAESSGAQDTLNQSIYTLSLSENFIPEPTSLVLLAAGGMALAHRRRTGV